MIQPKRRPIAIAARRTSPNWPAVAGLLALALAVAAGLSGAHSQTLAPGTAVPAPESRSNPPSSPPAAPSDGSGLSGATKGGVVHPPASIDPGMTKATPDPGAFPTPVIRPPGATGDSAQPVPK